MITSALIFPTAGIEVSRSRISEKGAITLSIYASRLAIEALR
jgi:hypothetical protein